jgi:hypothetical protein
MSFDIDQEWLIKGKFNEGEYEKNYWFAIYADHMTNIYLRQHQKSNFGSIRGMV